MNGSMRQARHNLQVSLIYTENQPVVFLRSEWVHTYHGRSVKLKRDQQLHWRNRRVGPQRRGGLGTSTD